MNYVYMLQNVNDSEDFYLGCTSDLRRRIEEHNSDLSPSTRGKSWRLVYYEAYTTLKAARRREASLKRNSRMRRFLTDRVKASLDLE